MLLSVVAADSKARLPLCPGAHFAYPRLETPSDGGPLAIDDYMKSWFSYFLTVPFWRIEKYWESLFSIDRVSWSYIFSSIIWTMVICTRSALSRPDMSFTSSNKCNYVLSCTFWHQIGTGNAYDENFNFSIDAVSWIESFTFQSLINSPKHRMHFVPARYDS